MTEEITRPLDIRPSSYLLWIVNLTGPIAFAIDMQSRFALVQWACFSHRAYVLHVITLTAFLAAAASTLLSWVAFNRLEPVHHRARFMAMSGFILSATFALAILANAIPHIFLTPCD